MTKIPWTDRTWNPVTGCTKCSPGCENCYAEKLALGKLAGRGGYPVNEPFRPGTVHADKMDAPLHWKKPQKIFVCSMGDLFHEDVPFPIIDEVIERIKLTPHHTYQILTKRPKRAWNYLDSTNARYFPSNTWLGVTVCNQAEADEKIPVLLQIPATVRFVSVEPMLGEINLGKTEGLPVYWEGTTEKDGLMPMRCGFSRRIIGYTERKGWVRHSGNIHPYLDWVICGGETGANARPMNPDWARALRDQCKECGVPFFFKQMTKKQPIPEYLLIREFPKGGTE